MSLTANNSGGSKSQRIASQRKVLDEASRKRRARKGILKNNIDNMTSRYFCMNIMIIVCTIFSSFREFGGRQLS